MKVTSATRRSMRRHLVAAIVVVSVLVVGVGGWAATAVISGAVVASGSVVIDSNVKKFSIQPAASLANFVCMTEIVCTPARSSCVSTKP